jgi:hypothetical protein
VQQEDGGILRPDTYHEGLVQMLHAMCLLAVPGTQVRLQLVCATAQLKASINTAADTPPAVTVLASVL